MIDLLRRDIAERFGGSQAAWARAHGVTDALVSLVLCGHKAPGPSILRPLGLKKVKRIMVGYERAASWKGSRDEQRRC